MVGYVIAFVLAWIVNVISDPHGVVVLKVNGDVDGIAETVRQKLEELMRKYGNNPKNMDVEVYSISPGKDYVFKWVLLKYYNKIWVYSTYKYPENKEVKIYIEGLDRWKIKRELKKALKNQARISSCG
jgi:2-hydroxy-3-keto-5-methylthiopentenyl-1-phosphate phosphatase